MKGWKMRKPAKLLPLVKPRQIIETSPHSVAVSKDFKWRSSSQGDIPMSQMKTGHLFNTVRMIWNNFMPLEATVVADGETPRFYTFSARRHSKTYMLEAIKHGVRVLSERWGQLNPSQQEQLRRMADWFNKDKIEAEKVLLPNGSQ